MTQRRPGLPGILAASAVALALGACAEDPDFAPFGRRDPVGAPDSLTVRRVMGTDTAVEPLRPEGGNVWPAAEAQRATLANPDGGAAPQIAPTAPVQRAQRERGPPPLEPRLQSEQPGPFVPPEAAPNPRSPPPGRLRRGSSTPPGVLEPLDPVRPPRVGIYRGEPATPPAPVEAGRVIQTPGGPAVISGGTGAIQSYTIPGGGTGTAINQGSTTTLIGPDGRVQVVPNR